MSPSRQHAYACPVQLTIDIVFVEPNRQRLERGRSARRFKDGRSAGLFRLVLVKMIRPTDQWTQRPSGDHPRSRWVLLSVRHQPRSVERNGSRPGDHPSLSRRVYRSKPFGATSRGLARRKPRCPLFAMACALSSLRAPAVIEGPHAGFRKAGLRGLRHLSATAGCSREARLQLGDIGQRVLCRRFKTGGFTTSFSEPAKTFNAHRWARPPPCVGRRGLSLTSNVSTCQTC